MTKQQRKQWIYIGLALFWTWFIWRNSLYPSTESAEQSGWIMDFVNGILPFEIGEFVIRKGAHMFEFLVLAILWNNVLFLKYRRYAYALVIAVSVACIDEGIQLYVPGRSGEIRDVLVDVVGACVGLLLVKTYKKCRAQK